VGPAPSLSTLLRIELLGRQSPALGHWWLGHPRATMPTLHPRRKRQPAPPPSAHHLPLRGPGRGRGAVARSTMNVSGGGSGEHQRRWHLQCTSVRRQCGRSRLSHRAPQVLIVYRCQSSEQSIGPSDGTIEEAPRGKRASQVNSQQRRPAY
jgi:hypothetical protein